MRVYIGTKATVWNAAHGLEFIIFSTARYIAILPREFIKTMWQ